MPHNRPATKLKASLSPYASQWHDMTHSIMFWNCVGCICIGCATGCIASTLLQYASLALLAIFFIVPAIIAFMSMVMIIMLAAKTRR